VQRDRERVGGARDLGRHGRMEHPFGEDRARSRDAGLDVVVLDRGDEPDVGIVEEGLQVRRRTVSRTSPSALVVSLIVVRLIGPNSRLKCA